MFDSGPFAADMGECHSCTQRPMLLKMAILYHRNPSLSTDSSHGRPAGNHSSACLFFRIAAAITSFTLSCLMAAGYFLTISASAALAVRSSSLSSTNRAERSSQARILCHYFNLMALSTSGVLFIGGGCETQNDSFESFIFYNSDPNPKTSCIREPLILNLIISQHQIQPHIPNVYTISNCLCNVISCVFSHLCTVSRDAVRCHCFSRT